MAIKIVTDSASSIPRDVAEKYDIAVVPLSIRLGAEEFPDLWEDDYAEFYKKFAASGEFPRTSLPSPEAFDARFRPAVEAGDEVICVTIASTLSGTYNSACTAAEPYGGKVFVVDSGANGQAIWFVAEEIAERVAAGATMADIRRDVEEIKQKSSIVFVPETMEYLKRGGRITLLKATITSILHIKPQLTFYRNELTNTKKSIGMVRAVRDLVEAVPEKIKRLFVAHIGDTPFFEKLKQAVADRFPKMTVRSGNISPIVGAHVGPGAIGIAYYLA